MEKMRELLEELYKVSNLEGLVHLSRFAKANGMSEEAKYYWERYCAIKEYKFEQDAD